MEDFRREDGFLLRRDANFLLNSDPCLTAVGAPVVLARNYAGYASLGRRRQGRWGVGDNDETPFKMASAFLKDRHDLCVPVELLAGLIDEDSKLSNSARSWDMPDTVCSDLSWPGSCLENLSAEPLGLASQAPPLLAHTSGPERSHLALLRPRQACFRVAPATVAAGGSNSGKGCVDGTAALYGDGAEAAAAAAAAAKVSTNASAAIELKDRLALHAGPIRQISAVASRTNAPPRVFARCDYSATLVAVCKVVDRLQHLGGYNPRDVSERRIRRAKAAAGVPLAVESAAEAAAAAAAARGGGGEDEEVGDLDFDGFEENEKLVFSRRLTCAACSPFTPNHAAFLDEEFRLFHWHADRGAMTHGSGPLPIGPPTALENSRAETKARRSRNADVALDYGSHPRVLWVAGRHRAYRIDLRERPSPAALTPALDPGVYYSNFNDEQIVDGGRGKLGGRGEPPKVRSLAVGRRSAHDVFVAAGLHLACMDVRFPRDVVARWDLPQEVDQLRWLPGVPGDGADNAEEVILASGRRSPGFYVNTWARDVPGWRGSQIRLGLDDTSPAASAARRPLTFSLPATVLSEGETRSGGLLLALPPERRSIAACGGGRWFIHATSAGDVYGQRVEMRQVGGMPDGERSRNDEGHGTKAVPASPQSVLLSDRIQSMLPCGDVCLDPDAAFHHHPARQKAPTATSKQPSAVVAAGTGGVGKSEDNRRENARRRNGAKHKDSIVGGGNAISSSGANTGSGYSSGEDRVSGTKERTGDEGKGRRGGARSHGTSRAGEDGRDGGLESFSSEGDSDSHTPRRLDSEASRSVHGRRRRGSGSPRTDRRSRVDRGNVSESKKDDHDGSGGTGELTLSQCKARKRPRGEGTPPTPTRVNTPARRRAACSNERGIELGDGNSAGVEHLPVVPRAIVYFPLNAAALRASVEKVPDNALCGHRHLAPLVDLVASAKQKSREFGVQQKSGGSSATGVAAAVAQRRERDFGDLRDSKDHVADFLLMPRTPDELLTFCRRTLGLEFPEDPPVSTTRRANYHDHGGEVEETPRKHSNPGGSEGRGNSKTSSSPDEGGCSSSVKTRPRMVDATIAVDIARAVLAWGQPFRIVETPWRAAAVGQGYSVVSPLPSPASLPRVGTLVLCSSREVLKGDPSPFLRPGIVGDPLAVDVTVEDVRWLKDQWDGSW